MKKLIATVLIMVLCAGALSGCLNMKNPPVPSKSATASDTAEKDDSSITEEYLWDALDKLAEKGDIPALEEKELVFHGEVFTSEKAEENWSSPLSLAGKKVIVGHSGSLLKRSSDDASIPAYFPESSTVDLLPHLCAPSSFADNQSDCDYYVFYEEAEYSRSKGYYNGGIDKVTVATLVIVVDANSHEAVRLYNIGTDSPGMITHNPRGSMKSAKAEMFIAGMLRDKKWKDFSYDDLSGLLDSINDPKAYVVFDINDDLLDEVLVLYQDEESEQPAYHIYYYCPDYKNQKGYFTEAGPALQPDVKSFCHAEGKPGIIAEYDDTFLLYSLGGSSKVSSDSYSVKSEMEELKTEPVSWIDIK